MADGVCALPVPGRSRALDAPTLDALGLGENQRQKLSLCAAGLAMPVVPS